MNIHAFITANLASTAFSLLVILVIMLLTIMHVPPPLSFGVFVGWFLGMNALVWYTVYRLAS
jgi:hypothetical protein